MSVLQKVCQPLLVLAGSVERTLVHLQKETKKIHPKPKLTMQESKQKTGTEETDHQASGLILTCLQDSNRHTVHGQREREGGGREGDRQTDRQTNKATDRQTERQTGRQRQTDGERERLSCHIIKLVIIPVCISQTHSVAYCSIHSAVHD